MFEVLDEALDLARKAVNEVEPELLYPEDAAAALERFSELKKLASAGESLVARRIEETRVWAKDGHRSPAHWLAMKTGTSVGQARGAIETGKALRHLPALDEAFRSGELSLAQASEVADAATVDPTAEERLVRTAKTAPLQGLREEAQAVKAAAEDQKDAFERMHNARHHRDWIGRDGMFHYEGATTPQRGAEIRAALRSETEKVFKEARREGRRESPEAYASDALYHLVTRNGTGEDDSGPKALSIVRVDYEALKRGHPVEGEVCEVVGLGPVSAEAAKELLEDSVLRVVVTKGIEVVGSTQGSRTIPAKVKAVVSERDGHRCVVPHCGADRRLQFHHYVIPYTEGGPSEPWNIVLVCKGHHDDVHYRGHRLEGGPGDWRWVTPGEDGGDDDDRAPP